MNFYKNFEFNMKSSGLMRRISNANVKTESNVTWLTYSAFLKGGITTIYFENLILIFQ